MPSGFPPWPRVYVFFVRWRDTGLAAELHDRLREAVRTAEVEARADRSGRGLAVREGRRHHRPHLTGCRRREEDQRNASGT
ncbi:transposase [Streptomyces sp. enrichment culture]|uniref:transposase n=1 Tax=Streptomyces sp. enrichment culture TaxID=1795815 RepID=UPI003F574396